MTGDLSNQITWPPVGKYVVAVSGGVDSVCLVDLLLKHGGYELVVAHFNHGMRHDSAQDQKFVKQLARNHGLKFVTKAGQLGKGASEATAREARYAFLWSVVKKTQANNLLTAHHLDDALETAIFNAGRGADSFGLTPMHLAAAPLRPLLELQKRQLPEYAKARQLQWREDPTNQNLNITRNFIRQRIVPQLGAKDVAKFNALIKLNRQRQAELLRDWAPARTITASELSIPREKLISSNHIESQLALKVLLGELGVVLEQKQLARLSIFAKTGAAGKKFTLSSKLLALLTDDMITVVKKS